MEKPEKQLPLDGEVFDLEGHTAFLISPTKKTTSRAAPWIFYAPTLTADRWMTRGLPGPEETWMFEKFSDAGIAIAGIDVGESYGNPQGRKLFSALYHELVQTRGLSRKTCLLARSRGGLMLYNWAAENPSAVACVAGIYPVCNLISFPGVEKASGAYGMTEEELTAELAEHNPIDRLERLAKAGVPVFHIHGDSDTVVPLETNSGELILRYRQFGGEASLVVPKGQGHNMWPGWFQCQALVDFVIAHARAGQDATSASND